MATDKQDTFDRIKAIVVEKLNIDEHTIHPESTLQDLGADSLDMVELMMKMEDEFGVEIPEDETENLKSIGDVVTYLKAKSH